MLFRSARSSAVETGTVWLARAGVAAASAGAPLIVWPTAGDITADSPLLRAHPLTHGGITDSPLLGRTLAHGSIEVRRWLTRPAVPFVGVAAFIDAARAWQGVLEAAGGRRSLFPLERMATEALAIHHEHRANDLDAAKKFAEKIGRAHV